MHSLCSGALLAIASVSLSGCGGGGTTTPSVPSSTTTTTKTTTTTTTTTINDVCSDEQGQCDKCLDGNCLSCKSGYVFDNSTVSGGTCLASCSNIPSPPKPSDPNGFSGQAWPQMCKSSKKSAHFFGIGDWGGNSPGGTWQNGKVPDRHGGFKKGPDDHGQYYVARQMKDLASRPDVDPDFVINAGDNFYPGGVDSCGPDQATADDPDGRFQSTKDAIYGGPGMDGKPWLGVLGNHDFGGISMGAGWDQVIFHSWNSDTWRTPAPYWSQRVQYQDFAVQLVFLDTNYNDAEPTGVDLSHNICQGGYCWGIDNDAGCQSWFRDQYNQGIKMAEDILSQSTAEWHIVVTHYASMAGSADIARLNQQYGIDVFFAGHTHWQQLGQGDNGQVNVVSGGGGGVTTDSGQLDLAHGNDDALGFVDFQVNRTALTISMHSWGGCTSCDGTEGPAEQNIQKTMTISPHASRTASGPSSSSTPVEFV